MEQEESVQVKTLPELKLLKISNLTTFPQDLLIQPLTGINVLFGGNYSGKTTVVNAIKFGIFGLTLDRADEDLSARYFASRIKEHERKSLDIIASFMLNGKLVTIKRTLFSSGPQRLDVQVVDPNVTPGAVVGSFSTSRDYLRSLCEMMGLENLKDVEFVLNLLLADEDRNTILWHQDCEKMILKLLTPEQEYAQLNWLERETEKKKAEISKVSRTVQDLSDRLDQEQTVARFFVSGSDKLRLDRAEETVQKIRTLRSRRDEIERGSQDLRRRMTDALEEKSKQLDDLSKLQSEKEATLSRIDALKLEKYKAIMYSDDPEGVHIIKHLVHEKRCPYCDSDLSATISERETRRLCIFCGHEIGAPKARGIDEVNQEIAEEEQNAQKIKDSTTQLASQMVDVNTKIKGLEEQIRSAQSSEAEVRQQLEALKDSEEVENQLKVVDRELQSARLRINEHTQEYERLNATLDKLKDELEETQGLYTKGREIARNKMREAFGRISVRFSQFVREATNGEIDAELSFDMLPSLKGRKVYAAEDISQFERIVMDIGFRIAVVSWLAENSRLRPFLVLETPDETTDESYLQHLARALVNFTKDMSILITSSNTLFMKSLLESYDSSERKKRLLDLSASGTLTQKSYYFPLITEWIG